MSRDRRFVFVVCGGEPHLAELERALAHLRRYAEAPAIWVTDRRRLPAGALDRIAGVEVVDVETPDGLSDAQAAIHLKTSLPRHLPAGPLYAYLDSDVLAVREGVDQLFLYRLASATFAPDHCRMRYFSPYAVRCGCLTPERERRAAELDERIRRLEAATHPECRGTRRALEELFAELRRRRAQPPDYLLRRRDNIARLLERYRGHPNRLLAALLVRVAPRFGIRLAVRLYRERDPEAVVHEFFLEESVVARRRLGCEWRPEERRYVDRAGRTVMMDVPWHVERESDFRYLRESDLWVDADGEPVFHRGCDHLRQAIAHRFGVEIGDPDWQHWNGGVFLFDHEAALFFERWHEMTFALVDEPGWALRDQGTLIAAAWSLGLERQPTLPVEFNYLADYQKPGLALDPERGFTVDHRTWVRPFLVHVYHHWGDRDWPIWRWLESRGEGPIE